MRYGRFGVCSAFGTLTFAGNGDRVIRVRRSSFAGPLVFLPSVSIVNTAFKVFMPTVSVVHPLLLGSSALLAEDLLHAATARLVVPSPPSFATASEGITGRTIGGVAVGLKVSL